MKKSILVCLLILLTCSLTLVACSNVDFKITFVVNGENYATINTSGKEVVAMPQNPTKDGYTFGGWYWDNDSWQRPFTANSLLDEPLTADMKVYAKFVENHQHDYAEVVTNATCAEDGCTTFTCDCGHSYVGNQVEALGHKFTNYISDNNATYEQNGTKTATCTNGCGKTDTVTDIGSMLVHHVISFKTLTTSDNGTVYGKIPNGTTTFSFLNEVVTQGNATYGVYLDIICSQEVKSKTVNLVTGDNTFYIWAEDTDNGDVLYTVTIRVKPLYTVTFDTFGGSAVTSQTVEEDAFATRPTTTKTGYTFVAWDYDFTQPITQNKSITASWQANEYIVNFDGNGGNNPENIAVTYDDNYNNLPIPTRTGYAFDGWFTAKDGGTQITNETQVAITENQTLYAHWTINQYKLSITKNIGGAGTITQNVENGKQNYGTEITFKLDSTNLGYEYLGLYDGDNLLTVENIYSFTIPASDISYVAKWQVTEYTITYHLNGAENNSQNKTKFTVLDLPLTLLPAHKEKTDERWCTDETLSNEITEITTIGDISLYVKFLELKFTDNIDYTLSYNKDYYTVSKYRGKDKEINIPSTYNELPIKEIGNNAFSNTNISTINVPDEIWSIGENAFYQCYNLKAVTLPNTLIWIKRLAFSKCSNLSNITIPNNVSTIGEYAFSNCSSLTNINIPAKITAIPKNIFANCYSLKTVSIDGDIYSIGNEAFSGCSKLSNFSIPNSVQSIGEWAFYNCDCITNITLPSNLKSIAGGAFRDCDSLINIDISSSVSSIGIGTFYSCNNLQSITIPNSITTIEASTFYDCRNLLRINSTTDGTFILPNNITSINNYAFYGCEKMISISLPITLESFGTEPFENCNNLTKIFYDGSIEDWNRISYTYSINTDILYLYSATQPSAETDINYWHYDENNQPTIWKKEEIL